jgi:hypothetical protein
MRINPDLHPQTWSQVYADLWKNGMPIFTFLLFTTYSLPVIFA